MMTRNPTYFSLAEPPPMVLAVLSSILVIISLALNATISFVGVFLQIFSTPIY